MKRSTLWILAAVVIAIIAIGGIATLSYTGNPVIPYGGTTTIPTSTTTSGLTPLPTSSTTETTTGTNMTTSTTAQMKSFTIQEQEYMFIPAAISVNQGDTVSLTIQNIGATTHSFLIQGLNVAAGDIPPGQSQTVTFTASQTGIFTFICPIDGHASLGMTGTLTVS